MVIMGDNINSVYNGTPYNGIPTSNDDTTAEALCDAIKASPDHIQVWAVSPTGAPFNPVLDHCANYGSTDGVNRYIYNKPTQADTKAAVLNIANNVLYGTLHLSQ